MSSTYLRGYACVVDVNKNVVRRLVGMCIQGAKYVISGRGGGGGGGGGGGH